MIRSNKEQERSAGIITRRGLVLTGVQVAFMGVLGARMRQLQIEDADQYRMLSDENRMRDELIAPARGLIYDRNGIVIADNEQTYQIVMKRENTDDIDTVVARLQSILDLDPEDLAENVADLKASRGFVKVVMADRLTWDQISRVAVNAPALPGVTPEVGLSRLYPLKDDFAHIVGYVGPVSDYDLSKIENPDPLFRTPKFQIGKIGAEARMEDTLRGAAGVRRYEQTAGGREVRELDRREGEAGPGIQLTIDANLQNFAQERLKGESAGSVVIDCETGDLLAMASAPAFDPNLFVRGISVKDYGELRENEYRPLFNKTVQGTYPPGSTFKMMTGLAALRANTMGPGETVYCPGHFSLGGRRFHCWKRGGHGWCDLDKALVQSCDVYFYEAAKRTGIDRIHDLCLEFGLGTRFDLPVSAVAEGLIPSQRWKAQVREEVWRPGDTINASIGQGYVLTSPLQLAVMTARIASGRAVVPRLVKSVNGVEQPIPEAPALEVSRAHLDMVRRGMHRVSNSARGTARRSRIVAEGMDMAGKTGTSQVRNITAAERARGVTRNDQLPWNRRDHGLFVCFAPYDKPKYAVATIVEHGGGGSSAAAPPSRDILLYALYGGLPPLDAYPSDQRERMDTFLRELNIREPLVPEPVQSRA